MRSIEWLQASSYVTVVTLLGVSASAPYLDLKPRDIRTERYGDVGLVTFTLELRVGGRELPLQRRTLLFIREGDAWKLAHMHASGASQP